MFISEFKEFGKYKILSTIAQGGMGELCKAVITGEEGFEKLVAIKKLHPHLSADKELLTSFIEEARLAALLQHHNVVCIYDFGSVEGTYYIAMEYLAGRDLSRVLERAAETGMPLSLEHALLVASRLCAGLEYAHNLSDHSGAPLNIIHRDISPQNILITFDGNVKIIDFGIAKTSGKSTQTRCGTIKGKIAYMSPEQARAQAVDRRSDIFSAGILLYEMVTGSKMFTGETTVEVLQKVCASEYASAEAAAAGLPAKIYEILNRALAPDPAARYQTDADMLTDIEDCMAEHGLQSSAWSLNQYMRKLFEAEIAAEQAPLKTLFNRSVEKAGHEADLTATHVFTPDEEQIFEREITNSLAAGPDREPERNNGRGASLHRRIAAIAALCLVVAAAAVFGFQKYSAEAMLTRADACMSRGQFAEATRIYEQILERHPEAIDSMAAPYTRALQNLPDSYAERARAAVQQNALAENPRAWFFLGFVCGKMQDRAGAIAAYETVVQLDPRFAESYFNLGHIYAQEKNYPEAEKMFCTVVELAPSYIDEALYNLAVIVDLQGRKEECGQYLQKALRANPDNEKAQTYMLKLAKGGP